MNFCFTSQQRFEPQTALSGLFFSFCLRFARKVEKNRRFDVLSIEYALLVVFQELTDLCHQVGWLGGKGEHQEKISKSNGSNARVRPANARAGLGLLVVGRSARKGNSAQLAGLPVTSS